MMEIFGANRNAVVTGASAGIGSELAKALAPKLDCLVVVARRVERLLELRNELQSRYPALKIVVEAADLAEPEAVQHFLEHIRPLDIDILVNNAGLGESELFESSPWGRIHHIVQVNIVALLQLTHSLLPAMIKRGHGAILNIGSGAGYAAMPNAAVYTASKHFVRAFTESLRAQLAGTGIIVSEAAPGPVESEFDRVAGIEGGAITGQSVLRITAKECAADIVRGFERGSPAMFPGRNYRWLMKVQPLLPRRVLAKQLAKAARKLRSGRAGSNERAETY